MIDNLEIGICWGTLQNADLLGLIEAAGRYGFPTLSARPVSVFAAVEAVGEAGDGAAIAAAPLVSGVAASEAVGDAGKGVGSRVGRRLRLDAGVAVAGTITGEGVLE